MPNLHWYDSIFPVNRQHPATPQWLRLVLLTGILVSFGLRLFRLGAESLWYDETVSAVLASKPIPALIAHTAGDIHPPGYYLLLHFWRSVVQPTPAHGLEFLYAWPSLCFGVLIVALLYPLGRQFFPEPVALIALWLAALNPFHIWYSQEVRMYTLGAALGLLCLWALIKFGREPASTRWLAVTIIAGALGLYTLYYFLFLLAALNLIALVHLGRFTPAGPGDLRRRLMRWFLAQLALLLLWSPWLPIFWRQAVAPPVPPWRTSWTSWLAFAQDVSQSLSALSVGQSTPGGIPWPWALITLATVGLALYVNRKSSLVTGIYVFFPIILIYLVTLTVTPVYHVRYLFLSAPAFTLLMASAWWTVRRFSRVLAASAIGLVLLSNGWSLQQFWFNPLYQSDDHRAAVAYLAEEWRPGDLILVNAGWVYTALATYWPDEQIGSFSALPPPIAQIDRLTPDENLSKQNTTLPVIMRTGSVDGAASLGWGDPASDFFAVSAQNTVSALEQLAGRYARIWHYRQYDTVNDPDGLIRNWLGTHTTLRLDLPFSGRDFLRLQRYEITQGNVPPAAPTPMMDIVFGSALRVERIIHRPEIEAGSMLYVTTQWQALSGLLQQTSDLSISLRLYDRNGALLTQRDTTPFLPTSEWQVDETYTAPLALPIPVAARPGEYTLALVVYDQQTGASLAANGVQVSAIGTVRVLPAQQAPELDETLARFDYIDLVTVQPAQATVRLDEMFQVDLVWRPSPASYTDTYLAVLELRNATGAIVQSWEDALGGWDYPSGEWRAGFPVLDQRRLSIAPTTPPGSYTLMLRVLRNSDRQVVTARQGWWALAEDEMTIGQVAVAQ